MHLSNKQVLNMGIHILSWGTGNKIDFSFLIRELINKSNSFQGKPASKENYVRLPI